MPNQNIPGVSFHYQDTGKLVPVITGPVTRSVLIVGTAVDGPINRVVPVTVATVEALFGPMVYDGNYKSANGTRDVGKYNGNDLVRAFSEVTMGGSTDVYAMRVGSATTTVAASPSGASYTSGTDTFAASSTPLAVTGMLGLTLTGLYPGTVYNGMGMTIDYATSGTTTTVTGATLTIRQDKIGKGASVVIPLTDQGTCITKKELLTAINSNSRNMGVLASYNTGETAPDGVIPFTGIASGVAQQKHFIFAGGTNGVRSEYAAASGMYAALIGSPAAGEEFAEDSPFAVLESVEADIVHLSCLYADENIGSVSAPNTVAIPLAKAIYRASLNENPMTGVLGTKPLSIVTQATITNYVSWLTQSYTGTAADAFDSTTGLLKMGYFVSEDAAGNNTTLFSYTDPYSGETVDLGRYMLLCAGPDVLLSSSRIGGYVNSYAGVLAGYITTIPGNEALTNKAAAGIRGLAFSLANRQINKLAGGQPWNSSTNLSGMGGSYVVLRRRSDGLTVINADNTCASKRSDYTTYQVKFIADYVAAGVKAIVAPFIGKPNNIATQTAIETEINGYLSEVAATQMIAAGKGGGYDFNVYATTQDQLLGRLNVDLLIRPALQIKRIAIDITVAPPTG